MGLAQCHVDVAGVLGVFGQGTGQTDGGARSVWGAGLGGGALRQAPVPGPQGGWVGGRRVSSFPGGK